MSNNKSNELMALEWLLTPLNEQMDSLHHNWQQAGSQVDLTWMANSFHALSNVLQVANLSIFARLAQTLKSGCLSILAEDLQKSATPKLLYASKLLQYELNRYVITGLDNATLIELKIQYINHLIHHGKDNGENEEWMDGLADNLRFSSSLEAISGDLLKLSANNYRQLLAAWRHASAQLLDSNRNDNEHLSNLKKVVQYLRQATDDHALKNLWQLTNLWLSSLMVNDEPLPSAYAYLLSELDQAIALQKNPVGTHDAQSVLWLENVLIDIYVQLNELKVATEETYELLSSLSGSLGNEKTFFSHILGTLEGVLFGLAGGEILIEALEDVQAQFARRGWSFYKSYTEQIIQDIRLGQDNPDLFAQMQWQINTQLQDLYSSIQNTYDTIEDKIGESIAAQPMIKTDEIDPLRRVRILVEDIKSSFGIYLHSKALSDLAGDAYFEELNQIFNDMFMSGAAFVSQELSALFDQLKEHNPQRVSWQFAQAMVDAMSSLELFLDGLAKQVFDDSLLLRAKERLALAKEVLGEHVDEANEFVDHKIAGDVVRYDDSGEVFTYVGDEEDVDVVKMDDVANQVDFDAFDAIAVDDDGQYDSLAQADVAINDESSQVIDDVALADAQVEVPDELSENYLLAKQSIKADEFDFDEDIREIFIEEVQDVMEAMADSLVLWQKDPKNFSPLTDIRRGFHTLKGSGRMVGAFSVGDMAWAVENMLNRVLDHTLAPSREIVDFVGQTAKLIPTLVADFAKNQAPSIDPAITVLKAHNILAGRAINDGMPSENALLPQADMATDDANDVSVDTTDSPKKTTATASVMPSVLLPFLAQAQEAIESSVVQIDEDIKEIFIEEAHDVLAEITPQFEMWQQTQDRSLLMNIRRGFHTLKGSGRMVGANELGELAWAMENMLNRVLDGAIKMNAGMSALLSDVLFHLDELVSIFANDGNGNDGDNGNNGNQGYPKQMIVWKACAHAYSREHGDEFDYRDIRHLHESVAAADQVHHNATMATDDASSADSLQSIKHEIKDKLSNAEIVAPLNEEERQLCHIFIEEARCLLTVVTDYLQEHQDGHDVPISDDIVRTFHTMRSASGLRSLSAIGEVGSMIEHQLQILQKNDVLMNQKHLKALASSVALIQAHLDAYEANAQGELAINNAEELAEIENLLTENDHQVYDDAEVLALISDIDLLLDAELDLEAIASSAMEDVQAYAQMMLEQIEVLKERTMQMGKFQRLLASLAQGYAVLERHAEQASDDELIDCLLSAHAEMTGLFDSLAGSMSLRLNDKVLNALDEKVADIQEYYRSLDSHELIEKKSGVDQLDADDAKHAVKSDAVELQEVTTDDDLLEIFLEEAGELDSAIGRAFGQWREDTSNIDALKELQRHLHTIKGGARLSGITSIGDLTHEAETVYEQMVAGKLEPSVGWVRVMQSVQDILSLQIDEVRQNKRSFFATQAVRELQQFLSAGDVPEGANISLPVLTQSVNQPKQAVTQGVDEAKSDFELYQESSWHGQLPNQDILDVFLADAEELIESSFEDFQAFKNNTGDIAVLQSLQRKLHTLKGGARLVSANGVADLAHAIEAVYDDLASRRRPATKMVVQLLLACHDWLGQAIVLLKSTLNPQRPTPLIEALEGFSQHPDSLSDVPEVSLAEDLAYIVAHEEMERQRQGGHDISRMPPTSGLFVQSEESTNNNEMIRISADLMERMINLSGEAAINRARIDMSMSSLTASIEEMGSTVQRLHDQLRRMDIELEEQILAQIDDKVLLDSGEFDPLEMDQYSSLNQLSKSLSESASDLLDLKATLLEKTRDGENLLLQLSRTQTELQDGLMNSRMVPFSRLTPRLQRIVRQTSAELGKSVELSVINADDEMDRTILERITSPLEHMLRNAVDHGIELPDERESKGKSRTGYIVLEVVREGSEVLIHLTDDGAGINVDAVRQKAISQGLIDANDTTLTDLDIMQYIFNAGLSTTNVVTQISGRGVGMDVVRSEIRQLGGSVSVDSVRGQGSKFTMRVPLTVAVSDALIVRVADRHYGIPLGQIERVTQVSPEDLLAYYQSNQNTFSIDNQEYRLRYLNEILSGHNFSELMNASVSLPVIIVKNQAGQNLALQVDEIIGSRIEVVVKPLGRQLSHVAGISAATIMGDGSVMLILDLMALIRNARARVAVHIEAPKENRRPIILVVDDSVTVRKVTSRFLERQGFEAVVAKDGVDAIEILQELNPDLMLLDIEMPRLDGFEVATQVRHNQRLKDLPIIMITSRTGEKHRERAFEIGVNDYMGKPFQENELLERIMALLPDGLLVK